MAQTATPSCTTAAAAYRGVPASFFPAPLTLLSALLRPPLPLHAHRRACPEISASSGRRSSRRRVYTARPHPALWGIAEYVEVEVKVEWTAREFGKCGVVRAVSLPLLVVHRCPPPYPPVAIEVEAKQETTLQRHAVHSRLAPHPPAPPSPTFAVPSSHTPLRCGGGGLGISAIDLDMDVADFFGPFTREPRKERLAHSDSAPSPFLSLCLCTTSAWFLHDWHFDPTPPTSVFLLLPRTATPTWASPRATSSFLGSASATLPYSPVDLGTHPFSSFRSFASPPSSLLSPRLAPSLLDVDAC
ncbi:hypothetical protein MSAN_01682800 [Mycena sanguinolenta]|uniref:Uncharacterized protein n=1 Tax=Mycena sanguinolenta TaxID=230812 RepID=A0A8H6XWL5_9AGAR|nr:hypothetical protein MSAN_01682800 [Mycena sanguinolenta]